MKVNRRQQVGGVSFELVDDHGETVIEVDGYLRHLTARGCSPHTLSAYAHDLLHFYRFLQRDGLSIETFGPAESLALLVYLRQLPSRRPAHRLGLALATVADGQSATRLAPATINRIFAAVSSFYEHLILLGSRTSDNPMQMRPDPALARVSERHVPLMGSASRQCPIRRAVRVKTVVRLPRPLSDEQVSSLVGSLGCWRDRALMLLMLDGGLRPGEALSMHLEDVQYGQRRVIVRYRTDHPKGARTKSRTERVVDLHEPRTLDALNRYVMDERPRDSESPIIFLVGGRGARRREPLSYAALVKLFQRHCERAGIRAPWVTPHALRHTHATRLWEGGMRELTLQKRLGHASPESTRMYTRVSDQVVVAEYQRALGVKAVR
ncbi:MAG: tyrosine-type recombinase/integrase [Chloroflexi bacterium]|nr:tyrosine-type recombinase/integrase [Chloroflexota bacterium]